MRNFHLLQKNNLWFGSFPLLENNGFVNGCSCRINGVSDVAAGTLNLALHVGDNPQLVVENRQSFAEVLGVDAAKFTTCQQVHGSKVVRVTEELIGSGAVSFENTVADTDSLICNIPDVPLMLFYADCVPVLLADNVSGAVGLAHAGWRGTVAKIAQKTLDAMAEEFGTKAENVVAAIGPSIGRCCYEVDDFVRNQAAGYEEFFAPKELAGKYMLDLWGYNVKQLLEYGVLSENIAVAEVCTAHNSSLFCSYRAEKGNTGRMGVCLMARKYR